MSKNYSLVDGFKTNHFRGITAKYLSPTAHRGSRVSLFDTRHKERITISWDYKLSDLKSIAMNEIRKRGIKVHGFTYNERTNEYVILTKDFETMLR